MLKNTVTGVEDYVMPINFLKSISILVNPLHQVFLRGLPWLGPRREIFLFEFFNLKKRDFQIRVASTEQEKSKVQMNLNGQSVLQTLASP